MHFEPDDRFILRPSRRETLDRCRHNHQDYRGQKNNQLPTCRVKNGGSNGISFPQLLAHQEHVSHLAPLSAIRHTSIEMLENEQLAGLRLQDNDPKEICSSIAKLFDVKKTEVAWLEAAGSLLKFIYPAELKAVGAIPLSSSAVAARTARTKRAELFNSFTRVKHSSV